MKIPLPVGVPAPDEVVAAIDPGSGGPGEVHDGI